jgi:hypothetical protein
MYHQTKSARVTILLCTIIARAQQPNAQAAGGGDEPPRPAQQTMKPNTPRFQDYAKRDGR